MKKYITFFTICTLILSSCGDKDESKQVAKKIVNGSYHLRDVKVFNDRWVETNNGELITGKVYSDEFNIEVKDGKFHGVYIKYESGILSEIGTYSNGELNGVWKSYDSGKLTSEKSYKMGRLDGKIKKWEDGVLVSESHYVNGKLNGASYEWDKETAQLIKVRTFKDDNFFGLQLNMSKEGDTLGIVDLVKGNGEFKYKAEGDEDREFTEVYKNGKLNGVFKVQFKGKTIYEITIKNNIPEGSEISYYDSGKERTRKTYVKGLSSGAYTELDENGRKILEGEYSNGLKNGVWKEFTSEGKLKDEMSYKNGKPNGIHKRWDYNGESLILQENYADGLLNGAYQEWYDKKMIVEKNFKNGQLNGSLKKWSYDGSLESEKVYENGKLKK